MFHYKKIDNKYIVFGNGKKLLTPNNSFLFGRSESMAISIVKELNKVGSINLKKLPLTSLAFFASNLSINDRKIINNKLLKALSFDNILYRPENNISLKLLMDKSYKKYISNFYEKN